MKKETHHSGTTPSANSGHRRANAAENHSPTGPEAGSLNQPAEAALRESEEKYRKLLEILPSTILIHVEGRFVFMNTAGLKLFGAADLSQIVGLPVIEYIHPDYRENALKRLAEIHRTGTPLEPIEEVLLDIHGNPLLCLVNSAIFSYQGSPAMIVSVTDITALKEYQRSLLRYRNIVSVSQESLAFIDPAGTTQAINAALTTALGRSVEDAVGMPFLDLMAPAARHDPARFADFLRRAQGGEEINDEALLDIPRLGHRHVQLSLTPFIEGGVPAGCIFTMRDITGATQTTQRMLTAVQQTREKIGMELHDGLSHQLLAVAVKSRLLAEGLAGSDPAAAAEASEIEKLINRAIEETRRLALGLVPADLEHMSLPANLRDIGTGLEKLGGIRCTLEVDESACCIAGEHSIHLYYIVREATANILKHARAHSVLISLRRDAHFVTLIVRDDGIGIGTPHPPADPVTGMGLTIMRYRALLIGASLAIVNVPEGGTEILCRFDASRSTPPDDPAGPDHG